MSEVLPTTGLCEFCDGTGSICLACRESITECECAEDSMPCTCNACGGKARGGSSNEGE
jgi:hypothetical protein